jgi:hypothetical protein
MFNGESFDLIPGSLKMVAVTQGGAVYGLDYSTGNLVLRDWDTDGNVCTFSLSTPSLPFPFPNVPNRSKW